MPVGFAALGLAQRDPCRLARRAFGQRGGQEAQRTTIGRDVKQPRLLEPHVAVRALHDGAVRLVDRQVLDDAHRQTAPRIAVVCAFGLGGARGGHAHPRVRGHHAERACARPPSAGRRVEPLGAHEHVQPHLWWSVVVIVVGRRGGEQRGVHGNKALVTAHGHARRGQPRDQLAQQTHVRPQHVEAGGRVVALDAHVLSAPLTHHVPPGATRARLGHGQRICLGHARLETRA